MFHLLCGVQMELIDAHTHLDLPQFGGDLTDVISAARATGLTAIVTCSTGVESFERTTKIVEQYRGLVYHSVGCSVSRLCEEEARLILQRCRAADRSSIVAIGEAGLDYHWVEDPAARKRQEPLFELFIDLAEEMRLPLVVHSRKAEAEAVRFVEHRFGGDVLMHCFDGPPEVAVRVRDNGWFITLPANFTNFPDRRRAARIVPLEQILLETDGPYMSPTRDRNEPANVIFGCRSLASLLDTSPEVIAKVTTENARRFYHLTP